MYLLSVIYVLNVNVYSDRLGLLNSVLAELHTRQIYTESVGKNSIHFGSAISFEDVLGSHMGAILYQ